MVKEYSQEGDHNLSVIHESHKFTNWMYSQIKPYLKGNILEVGSGLGTYSEKIIRDFKESLVLTDLDPDYVISLKKKYGKKKNVHVAKLDLTKKKDFSFPKIDSVFALNVVEHIDDDVKVLRNVYDHLNPGGKFIILVPAHMWLFNCIDEAVGHYRRYTRKEILSKVAKTRFIIKDMFFFNVFAIPGWILNGHILKKKEIGSGLMGLFNALVPLFSFIEKYILRRKLGISLVVVLEKPR